jgi:hypothetical protein
MRTIRVMVTALLMSGLPVIAWQHAAAAATPVVTANSDSAEIDGNEVADNSHQRFFGTDGTNFLTFAQHRAPAKQSAPEGTASLFESESATLETPAQLPFPLTPLNDVAVSGTVRAGATSTGVGPAVPNSDSQGLFDVTFTLDSPTAVFFSGFMQVANNDAADSCSEASAVLTGPDTASSRTFSAHVGSGCSVTGPRSTRFAQTITLSAGDYDLAIDYDTEVDADPGEPASRSGSATLTTNLSFLPPTASFTKSLSGSVGHFNGSASSPGLAGRPIGQWLWTFGDGTKKTTTTPAVSHTYPTSPRAAKTYTVSLQVVDDGGAVSAPVSQTVSGTATTLAVAKKAGKLKASGAVSPRRIGHQVAVTLARRAAGRFEVLATHRVSLSSTSTYATSFGRPAAGRCRITAMYAGDSTHLASSRSATFAC